MLNSILSLLHPLETESCKVLMAHAGEGADHIGSSGVRDTESERQLAFDTASAQSTFRYLMIHLRASVRAARFSEEICNEVYMIPRKRLLGHSAHHTARMPLNA
jgi:hypothetical protein